MNDVFRINRNASASLGKTHIVSTVVCVRGVRVDAQIGVYDHEHGRRQPLVIDVELQVCPATSDKLEQTFNYEQIGAIAASLCAEHIDLIETFAYRLATMCLEDRSVLAAEVCVTKPEALSNGIPSVTISVASTNDKDVLYPI